MKKENVFFSRQEFLNLPGQNSTASIVAKIIRYDLNEEQDKQGVDVSLFMSDCIRTIDFDFELDSDFERENAIHKVDTLIDVLQDFRNNLKKVAKHQSRLERKYSRRRLAELEKEAKEETEHRKMSNYDKRELLRLRAYLKA